MGLSIVLSIIFILHNGLVFGAPLDAVKEVNVEIESGNTKHFVEEKVQHENRHTNDTLTEEKHENEGLDDNEEEYDEDDYDVEGGENFSDEDYDDYNYQYAMDDVDPAAKYTEHNDDDEAEG